MESKTQTCLVFPHGVVKVRLYQKDGTPEVEEQMRRQGRGSTQDYRPNGKTGVAVGLLLCRKVGKIHVINEIQETEKIRFRC